MKKEKAKITNADLFQMDLPDEYLRKRSKEIVNDEKFMGPLVCMIGRDNGLTPKQLETKRFSKDFEDMVFNYLKGY